MTAELQRCAEEAESTLEGLQMTHGRVQAQLRAERGERGVSITGYPTAVGGRGDMFGLWLGTWVGPYGGLRGDSSAVIAWITRPGRAGRRGDWMRGEWSQLCIERVNSFEPTT